MTAPLLMSFDVACSAEHAFRVWTDRIGTWWPPDHTATGQAGLIVLEGDVGGRIYERTPDGVEHDWGEVTVWEPPARLVYLWHLRRDRADATEVEIRFIAQGAAAARIEIEHRGWERLGAAAGEWREQNRVGWQTLMPHYLAAIQERAVTERRGRSPDNPVGGWYGLRNGYRGRFGMYLPPLLEALGLAEVTHHPRNNSMRGIRS